MLWIIELKDSAIASSAGNKRIFQKSHHLINPEKKQSQNDKQAIYVTHTYASFADVFSTALFVTPLEKALKIIAQTEGLEALIIWADGKIYKSKGFSVSLNTK
jgi:thiamine biosynthesis lipoprotein ApbE